jgi:hypothetical protein
MREAHATLPTRWGGKRGKRALRYPPKSALAGSFRPKRAGWHGMVFRRMSWMQHSCWGNDH